MQMTGYYLIFELIKKCTQELPAENEYEKVDLTNHDNDVMNGEGIRHPTEK